MATVNFVEKLNLYMNSNPNLSEDELGVLLLIDNMYKNVPDDISLFRKIYAHLDPKIIDMQSDGIIFLKIAKSKEPTRVIKHRLNSYINVKLNPQQNHLSYSENMKRFKELSRAVTSVLDQFLQIGGFPEPIIEQLKESQDVRDCMDFYEMLELYRTTESNRVKYEILRKIGLIVLMTRISRTFLIEDIDHAIQEVKYVFREGLSLKPKKKRLCYLWVDELNKVQYSDDKQKAFKEYQSVITKRNKLALRIHSMQIIEYTPQSTKFNSEILHFEIRNKLRPNEDLSSASLIEKIVRKNIEFPKDIHDILGVKIVVDNENEIPLLVNDLSSFLGGSSTRRKEKNTLYKFGKRKLSKYSSKDYFVWKAIYDIALLHTSVPQINKMLNHTKTNKAAQAELKKRLEYFTRRPQDFVVEVQIQDFNSYLLSIAHGSPTDHRFLKMNQIRQNSFYKLYPKEIYEPDLWAYRREILNHD